MAKMAAFKIPVGSASCASFFATIQNGRVPASPRMRLLVAMSPSRVLNSSDDLEGAPRRLNEGNDRPCAAALTSRDFGRLADAPQTAHAEAGSHA